MGVRGFKHSRSTKKRLSDLNSGERHPFFGKKHTEEWKAERRRWWQARREARQALRTPE